MRLDKYLAHQFFASRTKAARAVAEGRVFVNGQPCKASDEVGPDDDIVVQDKPLTFVSEGGYKLRKALDEFGTDVSGLVCVDLGASTGGFTDCLLQAGAAAVYAVDVGRGQLDPSLCRDQRVRILDGINVRYLERNMISAQRIDVVSADLSFISLKLIFPVIARLLDENGIAYVLVKPQFECGGTGLDKHGIVKDRQTRLKIVAEAAAAAALCGLQPADAATAPVRKNKNTEYIIKLQKSAPGEPDARFMQKVSQLV